MYSESCICCGNSDLIASSAIVMPFISYRVFGHEAFSVDETWKMRDLAPGQAYQIAKTIECACCNAIFLDYRFSDAEMERLYSGYRGDHYTRSRIQFEPSYVEVADHYCGRANYISDVEKFLQRYVGENLVVLDWGGDSGVNSPFLYSAARLDIYDISEVEVFEPARKITKEEIRTTTYDLVTCLQVLEHVPEPKQVIDEIVNIMTKNTVLYIEVPLEELFRSNADTRGLGQQKRHWHEHVNFFSERSLKMLVERCGLQVIAYESLDVNLGWKQASTQMLVCTLVG